jgi:presenilin-like A22 family membrane protease
MSVVREESPAEWTVSWLLAILVAVFFLPPLVFVIGTGLLSIGIGISNVSGLPLGLSWALVVIYLGVAVTTYLRIRATRIRRSTQH